MDHNLRTSLGMPVKRARGLYIPNGGKAAYRLADDDNAIFYRTGEQKAAANAITGGGSGGSGVGQITFNINGGNSQEVYSVVSKVLKRAGLVKRG